MRLSCTCLTLCALYECIILLCFFQRPWTISFRSSDTPYMLGSASDLLHDLVTLSTFMKNIDIWYSNCKILRRLKILRYIISGCCFYFCHLILIKLNPVSVAAHDWGMTIPSLMNTANDSFHTNSLLLTLVFYQHTPTIQQVMNFSRPQFACHIVNSSSFIYSTTLQTVCYCQNFTNSLRVTEHLVIMCLLYWNVYEMFYCHHEITPAFSIRCCMCIILFSLFA